MTAAERAAEERYPMIDDVDPGPERDAYIQGRKDEAAEQSSTLAVEKVAALRSHIAWMEDAEGSGLPLSIDDARAVIAHFGPIVSTRDALIETLDANRYGEPDGAPTPELADALLASGAVVEPSTPTGDLRERLTWMADNRPDDDYAAMLREAANALARIEADRG
jgi:hypothetical protein